ncbi:efflux RND transporter periplasmic adaptor subunit [Nitrosococcus halophilus]|nr:efflux RND transporter periplasmic adaptor subunit [Nitrosococcus halophilus]
MKKIFSLVMGLALLVVVIAWLAGAFEEKIEPTLHPPSWQKLADQKTALVREIRRQEVEQAVGTLKAATRTQISAKVLATIEDIAVRAGDQVQKGDLLIRLDSKDLQARALQAEEVLEAAKANWKKAAADFERVQELYRGEAITKSQFDDFQTQVAVARAEYLRAKQALVEAKVVLSYAAITAPRSGQIVDRLAQPGDIAQPGKPLLVLYDEASLRLEAPVAESLAVHLERGKRLSVSIDALNLTFKGKVDEIVPQAHAPSRSFLVKMTLPRTEKLYEGMFGRLLIPVKERVHLCVPAGAVQQIGQLEFVEVVHPDGRLERRFVKTGRPCSAESVELLSGAQAGEKVMIFS